MDIKEIESAMHTLACGDTNYEAVARLASLAIVHDLLTQREDPDPAYSTAAAPTPAIVPNVSGTEFLDAAAQLPIEDVLEVVSDHLEALRVVFPKEYDAVMRRLWKLK